MANKNKNKTKCFAVRLGPGGKGKCLSSSVVGDIKYNRRKAQKSWKREVSLY